jgi:CRISPR/Cas system endoribonuclease Cas6 (RAMP superfamily)
MRLYIYADSGSAPRFHLPWDYHISFRSFVYDALQTHEPDLAEELHD